MNFPSFLEPVAIKLRGRHNSIRYRYYQLPKENLTLWWFLLRGRKWIDFYAWRLNKAAEKDLEKPPGEEYTRQGKDFLEFLLRHGLRPDHKFLDYGCGFLRAGIYLIPYLNKGNYVGIEISRNRLEAGARMLEGLGVGRDVYTTYLVRDCELQVLGDQKFDVVWANSVLTHMPEEDIRVLAKSLARHMATNGVFYFTFAPSESKGKDYKFRRTTKDYYYPTGYLREIFEECGYYFEVMPDGHAQEHDTPTVRVKLRAG